MEHQLQRSSSQRKSIKLGAVWQTICHRYQPITFLGEGTFGQVVKARDLKSGKLVAIKLIRNAFSSNYESRKLLREIMILRQLTQMEDNVFSPGLIDILIPAKKTATASPKTFDDVFLVMDCIDLNLNSIFSKLQPDSFSE